MGKTNPTYRDRVSALRDNWNNYRRALRRSYKDAWDQIWDHAQHMSDAGGAQNPRDPMQAVLLSICHRQQQEINELREQIEERQRPEE